MRKNPFGVKSQDTSTVESVICRVFDTGAVETVPEEETKQHPEKAKEIDEKTILDALGVYSLAEKAGSAVPETGIFNYVKASAEEAVKEALEKEVGKCVYYQTPETHLILREDSAAYNAIFRSWRKGLAGLFTDYRNANAAKKDFSFHAYSSGSVFFFHTSGYAGCSRICCKNNGSYALYVLAKDADIADLFESSFQRDGDEGWGLSGRAVLFVLDSIINTQASTVCALPLVLSKYPFENGIMTKPSLVVRPEKISHKKTYRILIKGWIASADIRTLSQAEQVEAKHTNLETY
ncbi:uncharacterized protein NEMAJ01_2191 [Nematocida major]|uniref:uncharacterized protein n=1 Tax=Nematocida major TaxID=1912982 RepID=UPI0020085BF8|nr:uncharacterized protein NEMAJ01_2191 [Nematocida major]KAH9387295.1 hypothetical protein NEMAJ01_2191 [Nematocida major]